MTCSLVPKDQMSAACTLVTYAFARAGTVAPFGEG